MFQPCKIGGLLDFAGPSTEVPVPSRAPSRFFFQVSSQRPNRSAPSPRIVGPRRCGPPEATTWRWNAALRTEVEVVVVADGPKVFSKDETIFVPSGNS